LTLRSTSKRRPLCSHRRKSCPSPCWRKNLHFVWESFTTQRSTTLASKVNLYHAIILWTLCGANLVTYHPGIEGERNPRSPPCGNDRLIILLVDVTMQSHSGYEYMKLVPRDRVPEGTGGCEVVWRCIRCRGGLVFKAHRPVYHSTLGSKTINKTNEYKVLKWSCGRNRARRRRRALGALRWLSVPNRPRVPPARQNP